MDLPLNWSVAAEAISLTITGLETSTDLVVQEVALDAKCASFDREGNKLVLERPAAFRAEIMEKDLLTFVRSRTPEGVVIESITLEPGEIVVEAVVSMIIQIRGTARCALDIEDGKRLIVRANSVDVLGGSMKSLVQKQLDALNPVLDVSGLPLDASLVSASIEPGKIVLEGRLSPKTSG